MSVYKSLKLNKVEINLMVSPKIADTQKGTTEIEK